MKRYDGQGDMFDDEDGAYVLFTEAQAEIDNREKRIAELEHAVRTMLAAVADAPEQFPGQNAAYLQTVAIPRAIAALALGVPK